MVDLGETETLFCGASLVSTPPAHFNSEWALD
jgi:hypothetical protein